MLNKLMFTKIACVALVITVIKCATRALAQLRGGTPNWKGGLNYCVDAEHFHLYLCGSSLTLFSSRCHSDGTWSNNRLKRFNGLN